jgi:hypothetical protein
MATTEGAAPTPAQAPRYQVLQKCYLNERLYDPELMPVDPESEEQERKPLLITYTGVPAYYLKPVNAAAKAMCEKHKDLMREVNPVDQLTVVGPKGADIKKIVDKVEDHT